MVGEREAWGGGAAGVVWYCEMGSDGMAVCGAHKFNGFILKRNSINLTVQTHGIGVIHGPLGFIIRSTLCTRHTPDQFVNLCVSVYIFTGYPLHTSLWGPPRDEDHWMERS